jgi:hypothetical protein
MALNTKKMDWSKFIGRTVNITMKENYGIVYGSEKADQPTFYEIVFKTGKLAESFDDALLLDAAAEGQLYKIYVPLSSIKCVEIF